jgi:hypothetical protein
MHFKKISKTLVAATLAVAVLGTLSYLTATGKAVLGPDPESLDAHRHAIATSTLQWMLACLAGTAVSAALASRATSR